MKRLVASVVPFVLVLAGSPTARAASKEIESLQVQVSYLQTQMTDIKRSLDESVSELHRLNESLADQNAFLRKGQADRRTQDEAVQAQLKELTERLSEIADHMQAMQAAPPAAPVAATVPGPGGEAPGPPPGGTTTPPAPREIYSQAYADYARGNYDLAIQEWQEYLRNYPTTDLSDNAEYWIGECHYAKARYEQAIESWNQLLRDYPSSDKLPDARFKKGLALEKLGRRREALVEYRYVMDRFPNSEAGRRAREKLNP